MLTQSELKELLEYDPHTGMWRWLKPWGNRAKVWFNNKPNKISGYTKLHIDGKQYQSHRLAFLYMTGRWPRDDIDHINRIRHDNRWSNLREANRIINNHNTSCDGGVTFYRNRPESQKRWEGRIKINYTDHTKYFHTEQEARLWYAEQKRKTLDHLLRCYETEKSDTQTESTVFL